MKITIVCVGKIKEKYFTDAIKEYAKRLSKYVALVITEVPDEKAPENMSNAQMVKVKEIEGERLLKVVKDSFVVALAIDGEKLTSERFSEFVSDKMVRGISHITFVIGGSLGLCLLYTSPSPRDA